jgi:GDP-D-mannose dehydratase
MLEAARRIDRLTALTYASSSSVYGASRKQPVQRRGSRAGGQLR